MLSLDNLLESAWNIFPYPYNIGAIIVIIFSFVIYECQNKYHVKIIKKNIKQHLHENPENFIYFSIVTIILTFTFCGYCYIDENYIFPEPPQDKFLISISPIYLDNAEPDFDTAYEIREKVENATYGRIEAIVLGEPAIKDDQEAIFRGKKAGSHLVIYGEQKEIVGYRSNITFHIVPKSLKSTPPESKAFSIDDKEKFHEIFSPSTPTISIVDSLTENVSSTVYALCALEYYHRFDYISAINTFSSIKNYENDDTILYYLANCYLYEGETNKSLLYFDKAIEINPKDSYVWNNKGCSLLILSRYDEAIKACDKAIEINPQNAAAWYNKGLALKNLGKYEEAIKAYDRVTEIDPQNAAAWYNKALALKNLGNYEDAIKAYDRAIEINEELTKAHNKTIEINLIYLDALYQRRFVLGSLGDYEDSIKAFEMVTEINSQYPAICCNAGVTFYNLSDYKETTTSDRTTETDSMDSDEWYNKGIDLTNSGNYEEAIKAFDKAIEIDPQNTGAWHGIRCCLLYLDTDEKSLKAFKEHIK